MAKPLYLEEDFKPKVRTHGTKSLSFFASMFSLFIYICVFYTFNLSPYSLLNNNIFWFFMSNTLILIIAADYGAFSSSKRNQDLYEKYVQHSQARNHASSCVPKYDQQVHKQCINPKQETVSDQNIPERVLEIVAINQPKKSIEFSREKRSALHYLHEGNEKIEEKAIPAKIYRRSKSDRSNRVRHVVNEEREKMVQRSETVKAKANVEEENEFSKMSNEDLNRRIEEFIHKFKSQTTSKVCQIQNL
ncbi:uncharacterized protein HKW66_Vig0067750 [Vigna angularis]|uniref:DUF4408 domain-containing protein n=3 Tax=Phaseolus angularis TaxID=3914 RepID=A0A8T0K9B9_PHAAN|nr:uncharacterized protein LOC108341011 [Vigna angularis]KAG2395849.1 uncharacterized protein HKW66_Vig0067750 [Vigna angularis]BAT87312.1 hypothetical protein VIGAN_05066800 [Vigna angularis var. angularis]